VSGRPIEKIRFLTESPNPFYKKFIEASEENLNVKSLTVTPCCHITHSRYLQKGLSYKQLVWVGYGVLQLKDTNYGKK